MGALKVVILGPSGVGKTTLKKIFFENENPINLLTESLEPTYGVETSHYTLGTDIAIHDLAGQQLDEWLNQSSDVFIESNLIICIVNSMDDWATNEKLINRIVEIRTNICKEALIAVLFHKIDLITLQQRNDLRNSIKKLYSEDQNIYAFMTSILDEFFLDTYKNFLFILRKCIRNFDDVNIRNFVITLNILTYLGEFNPISLNALIIAMEEPDQKILQSIDYLKQKKYIELVEGDVILTPTGENVIKNIQKKVIIKLHDIIDAEHSYIKGLLLSDEVGRTFFVIETSKNFWKTILTQNQGNPEPSLISMFLCAIKDFGLTLDKAGFSTIQLSGSNIQIVSNFWENIFSTFFLEIPSINSRITKILKDFTKDLFENFRAQINQFIKSGLLDNISSLEESMAIKLRDLNYSIEKSLVLGHKIPTDKLIQLYSNIESKNFNPNELKEIKNLLFYYALAEDPVVLEEIFQFLKKWDLLSLIE